MKWTVYCHTHTESGRRYVGLTSRSMERRWSQHVVQSRASKDGRWHFPNAIRKYGPEAFSHEVLAECKTLEDGNATEEALVLQYETRDPSKGFNLMKGGDHTPHPIKNPWDRPEFREKHKDAWKRFHTPQARAKQRISLTTEIRSAATKKAMARPDVKAKRAVFQNDPVYRAQISNSLKASLSSPEARERMSLASKESATEEVRAKRSTSIRAAYEDPEVKQRHAEAVKIVQNLPHLLAKRRAYRASPETKAKISAASTGKEHTPESIERQRRLYLERSSKCRFCDLAIEGKRSAIKGRVACQGCYALHHQNLASFLRPDDAFLNSGSNNGLFLAGR